MSFSIENWFSLYNKDTFIPELSFLAQEGDGKLIGQVVLSKTDITAPERPIIMLLPLPICVHSEYFGRIIAHALMDTVFEAAKRRGYTAVLLCGGTKFYRKVGFTPTYKHNIFHITATDGIVQWHLVRELVDGALKNVNGTANIL